MLHKAGVKTKYTAHSTRAASTSAAAKWIPLDVILTQAGWSSCKTFAQYYQKPTEKADFAEAVLQNRQ
jgi:hypothetical protein